MSDCKWVASDQPRVLPGRHAYGCGDEECAGCQPCTEPHCRVDGRTHAEGMCAECLASTREDLHELAKMCDALPAEAVVKGVHSEAMTLLAPVADPEARGHLAASVAAGRVPADWLDVADHERHPLTVLGGWVMVWEDVLERDNNEALTIVGCVSYLDEHLHRIAADPHLPVEDLARDLRDSRAHVEAVLHAGEQIEKGAPCLECRRPLVLTYGPRLVDDRWACKNTRCDVTDYTTAQYRGWVQADAIKNAKVLTAEDMASRFHDPDKTDKEQPVKASRVRVWGSRGVIRKRGTNGMGRTLYVVADVEARLGPGLADIA